MLCYFLLCSKVTQLYAFLFDVLFHYGLSQEIGSSSLCYTVGPCLSILNVVGCIYQPQIPSPSLFLPPLLLGNHKSDLCVYESFSVL